MENMDEISTGEPRQQDKDKMAPLLLEFTGDPSTTPFKESDLQRSQKLFETVVALLSPKITGQCSFEHVGSSAMADMPGKGSIDVMVLFENATAQDTTDIEKNIKILVDMGFKTGLDLKWTLLKAPEIDSVFVATITIPSATVGGQDETETVILHLVPPTSRRAIEFAIIKWLGEESEIFRSQYGECKLLAFRTLSVEKGEIDRIKFGELKRGILSTSVQLVQEMMGESESPVNSVNQVRDWCKINTKWIREFETKLLAKLDSQTAKELTPSHTAV